MPGAVGDQLPDPLEDDTGIAGRGAAQHHHELVAAETDHAVSAPAHAFQETSDFLQHAVALDVSVLVVHLLEAVEIDDADAHRCVLLQHLRQQVREVTAVG